MSTVSGDTIELAYRICQQSGTGLTRRQIELCLSLIAKGVRPDAIAHIVKELPAAIERRRLQTDKQFI